MLKYEIKSSDLLVRVRSRRVARSPDYPKFRTKSSYEIYNIDLFSYQIRVLVKWRFTKPGGAEIVRFFK